jgi:chromosome segregation ATPase
MKKSIFTLAVLLCCFIIAKADNRLQADTAKADTAKIGKKIRGLKEDLADYNAELAKAQKRLPTDSIALVEATSKADDALKTSKKAASEAVGGDVGDARNAEKKAKKASDAKNDAHDAEKQLKQDRKNIIKYTKKVQKTQKKIDDLNAQIPKL